MFFFSLSFSLSHSLSLFLSLTLCAYVLCLCVCVCVCVHVCVYMCYACVCVCIYVLFLCGCVSVCVCVCVFVSCIRNPMLCSCQLLGSGWPVPLTYTETHCRQFKAENRFICTPAVRDTVEVSLVCVGIVFR